MEVISLLHPHGENLSNRELGGSQSQSGYFKEEKKQLSLLGNKKQVAQENLNVHTRYSHCF